MTLERGQQVAITFLTVGMAGGSRLGNVYQGSIAMIGPHRIHVVFYDYDWDQTDRTVVMRVESEMNLPVVDGEVFESVDGELLVLTPLEERSS